MHGGAGCLAVRPQAVCTGSKCTEMTLSAPSSQGLICRAGVKNQETLSVIFQYNHQNGTLHLPIDGLAKPSPVALKVSLLAQL